MKNDIQPNALKLKMDRGEPLYIVDVRTGPEYRSGHVPGAVNIPLDQISSEIPDAGQDQMIVVVCKSGGRSSMACEKLGSGQQVVYNLTGGTMAWKEEGFPIERPSSTGLSVSRQTHLVASVLLIAAFILANTVNPGWIYLALLPTFGLMLDALTGICPMTLILRQMPWNRAM